MAKLLLLVLLLGAAPLALCCSAAPFVIEHEKGSITSAYVGYVVGDRFPGYERRVAAGEDPELVEIPEERVVRVVPVAVIKGEPQPVREVQVACGSSYPESFTRVVVVVSPQGTRLLPAAGNEAEVRNALGTGL